MNVVRLLFCSRLNGPKFELEVLAPMVKKRLREELLSTPAEIIISRYERVENFLVHAGSKTRYPDLLMEVSGVPDGSELMAKTLADEVNAFLSANSQAKFLTSCLVVDQQNKSVMEFSSPAEAVHPTLEKAVSMNA